MKAASSLMSHECIRMGVYQHKNFSNNMSAVKKFIVLVDTGAFQKSYISNEVLDGPVELMEE